MITGKLKIGNTIFVIIMKYMLKIMFIKTIKVYFNSLLFSF